MTPLQLELDCGETIWFQGAGPEAGPLPAVWYFAISGQESLTLDPFNQPAEFLKGKPLRVFSIDLPGHGPGQDKTEAIHYIAEQMRQGHNPIADFLKRLLVANEELIQTGWIDPRKIAAAGLSRGGFAAAHFAAVEKRVQILCPFAPLTSLPYHTEFAEIASRPEVEQYSLIHLAKTLCDRKIRCFIGNRDEQVGTDNTYTWIRAMVDHAFEAGERSPPIELVLRPSIGRNGHGTAPETFRDGAEWIATELLEI